MSQNRIRISVWSDIACPWCYVGKRRLEAALGRFEHRASVDVTWRAFELDPSAPRQFDPELSYAQRLAQKYATSLGQAQQMIDRMTEVARADGLEFHFERIRPGNTFDAHRVVHLAKLAGKQDAAKERLFRAYLCEGQGIGEHDTLLRLGEEVGLDPDQLRSMLSSDLHASAVRAEERLAQQLGIHSVPLFAIQDKYAVSGAQSAERMLDALWRAWNDLTRRDQSLGASFPSQQ